MGGIAHGQGGRTYLRHGERGGKQDAKLSIEGPDHWAAEERDQMPVQVGVCPGKTGEDM
jgi:hypothetical protein